MIVTSLGVCRKTTGLGPPNPMNIGTPPGTQLDCGVKAIFPARTSSMSFFITCLTQGIRFGLLRSATRNVGCLLVPLGTKGCAGSLTTGPGSTPGTASKNGPAPSRPNHPARFEEKSGGAVLCGAAAVAVSTIPMRATTTTPASNFRVHADIVIL